MSWLDYVRVLWPIASVVTPLIITAGLFWLRSQFALKTELAAERTRVDGKFTGIATAINDHETRLKLIEQDQQRPPSRHELFKQMSNISSRTEAMESTLEGIEKQVGTLNDYLHTLIERGLAQ
ncbi:MAG TPA: hypothetical protein VFT56_01170 [Sphingomonas sp.]|nr:hypothetical protein [Sphingomonas sp.]